MTFYKRFALAESENIKKRLFFAYEVKAPWPEKAAPGRKIADEMRHMTVVFVGTSDVAKLLPILENFPKPPIKVGQAGYFDKCLFLPDRRSRVVAWHTHFFLSPKSLINYCEEVASWLKNKQVIPDTKRPWLPHVTVARRPFEKAPWLKSFEPLPFFIKDLILFESLPFSNYKQLWRVALNAPFEELEHTADIAFRILGESEQELFTNAFTALAFRCPNFLKLFPDPLPEIYNLDQIIMQLNEIVGQADALEGCPFKAISFHGEIEKKNDLLCWEMVVDV